MMNMLLESRTRQIALVLAGLVISAGVFMLMVLPNLTFLHEPKLSYLDMTKRVVVVKGYFGWKTDTAFSTFGDVMDYAVRNDTRVALVRSKEVGKINLTQVVVDQGKEVVQVTTDPVEKFGIAIAPSENVIAYSLFRSNNPAVVFSPALGLWESVVYNLRTKESVSLPGYGPQFLTDSLVLTTTPEGYVVTNLTTSATELLPMRLLPLIDVAPTVNPEGNVMISYDPFSKRYTTYEIFRAWPELGIEPISSVESKDLLFPAFVGGNVAFIRSTPEDVSIDVRPVAAIDQTKKSYPLPVGTKVLRVR
jgi:hypothetical protein